MNAKQVLVPEPRVLMKDLAMGESPRWHEDRLWFSDWGAQEIISIGLDGKSQVMVRTPFELPFCIDWLPDGRLLIVSGRDCLLLRQEQDGSLATHADLRGLSDKGWNEIVVDGRGNAYINGSGFDLMAGEAFAGVIAIVTPDSSVRQVAEGIAFPNGMAITQDNSTLIVAESYGRRLTAFDIAADGSLSRGRLWADLKDGVPDGICIDTDNAIWYADVPNKRCVRVREGGADLQTINLDRGCFACMLGGVGRSTLYVLAAEWWGLEKVSEAAQARTGQLLGIDVPAPGVRWP